MRNENNTLPAFKKESDKQFILMIKAAYEDSFSKLNTTNKNIPEIFELTEKKEPWFFIFSSTTLHLPRLLTAKELKPSHFQEKSEIFNTSINRKPTSAIMCTGVNYIQKIENNWMLRRNGFNPFSIPYQDIQDPRYYCVYIIISRVKELCQFTISQDLIEEYNCLEHFSNEVLHISNKHLSGSDSEYFQDFLYEACEKISVMKKRTQMYYERNSIANGLTNTSNLLEACRSELVAFLCYSLSDIKSSETFDASYLDQENDPRMEENFRKSFSYKNIRLCYLQEKEPYTISKNSPGMMKPLFKLDEKDIRKSLESYNNLMKLLYYIPDIIKNIELLRENSVLHGDWETARDETLNNILKTNMSLVASYISYITTYVDELNKQNASIGRMSRNASPSLKDNIYYASKKKEVLEKIFHDMQKNKSQIKKRIKNIQKLDPDVKKMARNQLINNTEKLISDLESRSVIPPELTSSLFKMMKKNIIKNNSTESEYEINEITSINYFTITPVAALPTIKNDHELIRSIAESIDFFDQSIEKTFSEFREINESLKNISKWIDFSYEKENTKTAGIMTSSIITFTENEKYKIEAEDVANSEASNLRVAMNDKVNAILRSRAHIEDAIKDEISNSLILYATKKINLMKNKINFIKESTKISITDDQSVPSHYKKLASRFEKTAASHCALSANTLCDLLKKISELVNCEEAELIKLKMDAFCNTLISINYSLKYYGGDSITADDVTKKVPKHIKNMINIYRKNIHAESSLEANKKIMQNMLKEAQMALHQEPMWFSFFHARDPATQQIYEVMGLISDYYEAQYNANADSFDMQSLQCIS